MHIWVRLKNITPAAFIVPKEIYSETQLVRFHLLIPMGYMEYDPFFCAAMDTIKETANDTMHKRGKSPVHTMEILAGTLHGDHNKYREEIEASADRAWNNIPDQLQRVAQKHAKVYLDDFI